MSCTFIFTGAASIAITLYMCLSGWITKYPNPATITITVVSGIIFIISLIGCYASNNDESEVSSSKNECYVPMLCLLTLIITYFIIGLLNFVFKKFLSNNDSERDMTILITSSVFMGIIFMCCLIGCVFAVKIYFSKTKYSFYQSSIYMPTVSSHSMEVTSTTTMTSAQPVVNNTV
jgi:hypothetical protein